MKGRGRVRIVGLEWATSLEPLSFNLEHLKSFEWTYMKKGKNTSLRDAFYLGCGRIYRLCSSVSVLRKCPKANEEGHG